MFLFSRLSARAPEVLTTLIIFSLSSGVLGGILFYMDSTAPTVLSDMTSDVPIDMEVSFNYPFYTQNFTNPNSTTVEDIQDIVESQEYVITTEPLTFVNIYDWYGDDYYSESPDRNPIGPRSGKFRVLRGGSFFATANYLRAADRIDLNPSLAGLYSGFRCAIAAQN